MRELAKSPARCATREWMSAVSFETACRMRPELRAENQPRFTTPSLLMSRCRSSWRSLASAVWLLPSA